MEEAEMKELTPTDRYVQRVSLGTVAPLSHRFQEPLQQDTFLSEHLPQRYHLTTKESFRCPYKHCGSYVCKPTMSGRNGNPFEVRTAVLDFLPRVTLEIVSGGCVTTAVTKILMRFQNRHVEDAKIQVDPSINEESTSFNGKEEQEDDEDLELSEHDQFDSFVTVTNVECSKDEYEVDAMDIHTKKDKEPKDKTYPNGDFVKGKEAGIHLSFKPKYYEPTDIKFALRVKLTTKISCMDEHTKKPGPLQDVTLPYVLDFFLGQSVKPGNIAPNSVPVIEAENSEENESGKRHFARMETSAVLFDDGAKGTNSVPASPRPDTAPSEEQQIDNDLDLDGRLETETKSRGSQEFKRSPIQ